MPPVRDKSKSEDGPVVVEDDRPAREKADLGRQLENGGSDGGTPLLDKHGLPLVPQPTSRKDDPLNWSPALKLSVCLQIALLALIGPLASAVINPAFVPLARAFEITPTQASYELTVFLISAAVGPFLFVPLANVIGRRPVILVGNVVAAVTNVVAGFSPTWAGILITRVFNGMGTGCTVALGPVVISDIYFLHERGLYMGIFTLFLNQGAHFAPLIGGFTAQNLGWRYCFIIPGAVQLGVLIVTLFCLPETLFSRNQDALSDLTAPKSYLQLLSFRKPRSGGRKVDVRGYARPFLMMRYVCVVVPVIYYMTCLAYGSVLFAATGSVVYSEFYHFNIIQTGLILSIPLIIGNLIGEAGAGWVTDWLMYRYAKRHGGKRIPDSRLDALWLVLFLPIGTILNGVFITHASTTSWVPAAVGMAIASVGFQVSTTVVYAYCIDCYKPQSSEVSTIINFFRHVFSSLTSFYALPLAEEIGFQYAWLVFAFINIGLLLPLFFLRIYGERIRTSTWQKPPSFHKDD